MSNYVIHWFRRDLRLTDNVALHKALNSELPVQCIFIFDENILQHLPKDDKRVNFIYQRLIYIKNELNKVGGDLMVYVGKPVVIWEEISKDPQLKAIYFNKDYETYARNRDNSVYKFLKQKGIEVNGYKDQVIFEGMEIETQNHEPYKVYTPYSKQWKKNLTENATQNYEITLSEKVIYQRKSNKLLPLKEMGFKEVELPNIPLNLNGISVKDYDKNRDIPAKDDTTKIGTALRFGTMSIRQAVKHALKENETFLNELIWRDFFSQILFNFPYVEKGAFRDKYNHIPWRNNEQEFKKWCRGETGFPMVDAGMRELNQTGFMHNRVRMITASFLVKDLLIDWRWGEAYFAEKLMDFDLASNNGNWQWAAGTGCDAAPYFRIFNPESQQQKFDPNFTYIKKWIPEFGTAEYPNPMVDHKMARERCLNAYKSVMD